MFLHKNSIISNTEQADNRNFAEPQADAQVWRRSRGRPRHACGARLRLRSLRLSRQRVRSGGGR